MDRALDFALEEDSDLYFYQMMHRMNRMEAEKLEAEAEKNRSSEQLQQSYSRFLERLSDQNRQDRRKQWLTRTGNVFQRVAVFLLAFFIAGSCAALQVDAIREQLGRWLLSWNDRSMTVSNDVDPYGNTESYSIDNLSFAFGWLPDGCYLLDQSVKDEQGKMQKYSFQIYREDVSVGKIEIMERTVQVSLDNENAVMEYLDFEGYQQAIYLEKTYAESQQPTVYRALLAQNDGCIVYISNTGLEDGLSKEEITGILEQIHFMNS